MTLFQFFTLEMQKTKAETAYAPSQAKTSTTQGILKWNFLLCFNLHTKTWIFFYKGFNVWKLKSAPGNLC